MELTGFLLILLIILNIIFFGFYLFNTFNKSKDASEKEFYYNIKTLISDHQIKSLNDLQSSSNNNLLTITKTVQESLDSNSKRLHENIKNLNTEVNTQLKAIGGEVEKRLDDGFEKTSEVFQKLTERILIIDNAQNKIKELSENMVALQDVLSDKQSRGAFGEVQLKNLVRNVLPDSQIDFQKELSNGTRVDCLIKMPEENRDISVDSKFPLENYKKMMMKNIPSSETKTFEKLFKQDLKKHIDDISNKYIIDGETAEHAILFLPAEAIFAEIHAYHYDMVEYAHKKHVVLTSPNTLVALLTTIKSILKDEATKQQVHIIKSHLVALSKDFERFQKRVDNLTKHIKQANEDVEQVSTSSKKIHNRFIKIENVSVEEDNNLIEDKNNQK
jgi:DNA recombination protein RmuC